MTIKLLNNSRYNKKTNKRFFIVYKKYEYMGEVFYCVRNKRVIQKHDGKKYMYLERKTGRRLLPRVNEILGDKGFKKAVRKVLTESAKARTGESLHAIIKNREAQK